ncbi:MAG TPA: TetR/AcrR family transcriptional regulator [Gemmatimonadaceae bacterium]|nr:TetR/AcrR family transcriptional regulator [Gemmatimonadaceae bacterium]
MAAIEEFAEHGIAAAKLEDIAARAGVSKGTIYLYFPSKEDLFRAVVREIVVPRMVEADKAVRSGTPTEQLEEYMRFHWQHFVGDTSHAGWVRLVLTELHKHPDLAAFYFNEVTAANRTLCDILSRGMERGEFRRMTPQAGVAMIKSIAIMHALWAAMPTPPGAVPPRRATIDEMVDFVLHALRPDSPATPATPAAPATTTSRS